MHAASGHAHLAFDGATIVEMFLALLTLPQLSFSFSTHFRTCLFVYARPTPLSLLARTFFVIVFLDQPRKDSRTKDVYHTHQLHVEFTSVSCTGYGSLPVKNMSDYPRMRVFVGLAACALGFTDRAHEGNADQTLSSFVQSDDGVNPEDGQSRDDDLASVSAA